MIVVAPLYAAGLSDGEQSAGFVSLFNGQNLDGWIGATKGYQVADGTLVCPKKGGGNLYTEKEYGDFEFRFDFKLSAGANNGLGIRTPSKGNAAYAGMELQILDNTAKKYASLKPYQYHGSVYGVIAAARGSLKPVGEWNSQVVIARGSRVSVVLNGTPIVDADLSRAAVPETLDKRAHPGLLRPSGHIGFLGHGSRVEFRELRIKELSDNEGPHGFDVLFNGKNLEGWKGLVGNPVRRATMKPEDAAREQAKADALMNDHWSAVDGALAFDGKGSHLCTGSDYADFELYVDWKITPNGDSGLYLRGTPQVQIWDPTNKGAAKHGADKGSGGLWNNKKSGRWPLVVADNPAGEWNRFYIHMKGPDVTIFLNGKLIVDEASLENYWKKGTPIFPKEQIELQAHGSRVWFKNIFVRDLP